MKFLGIHIGYKSQGKILYIICLLLSILVIYLSYRRKQAPPREGFSQQSNFLVRRGVDVYDDFLAEVYDKIHQPKCINEYIFDAVEKLTQPSKEKSVLLDAGCGTGELVGYMHKKGYQYAFGLDKSNDMISHCQEKFPDIKVKQGDFMTPMTYDKNTFTHIMITGNTIYHIKDKVTMLRNLYYWLVPNGFLVLHLFDPMRFDPIPLTGRPLLVESLQEIVSQRITDSTIDFIDFVFKSSYDFSGVNSTDNEVIYQEVYIDQETKHVRQNEIVYYMNPIEEIVYMAQYVGFLVHGKMNLADSVNKDANQYMFVLERPH